MHMSLDRSVAGSTQVLPQFRDTKLAQLRFWQPSGRREKILIENDWKTISVYFIVNVVLLISSLLLLFPFSLPTPGWVTLGVWGFMTALGIMFAIVLYLRSRQPTSKGEMIELDAISNNAGQQHNFPIDPVMQRAITFLGFHGQEDCEECRLMRYRDDFQRKVKDWSNLAAPRDMQTFPHATVPSSHAATTKKHETDDGRNLTETKHHVAAVPIKMHPVRSTNKGKDRHCSLPDYEYLNEPISNTNFNNNTPTVIVTPPDVTDTYDDVMLTAHCQSFLQQYARTATPDTDLPTSHYNISSKRSRNYGIQREGHGVILRRSSVSKKGRGPVQKSLQRMKAKNLVPEVSLD